MPKTIAITSGKGGVGKTSISVNAAIELAKKGYSVCLLDADLGLANVDILLGIQPEKNLDDFLFKNVPLDEIIVKTEYGIDVIPGSSGVENIANLDPEQLFHVIESFSALEKYDYCLIDTSSGISRGVISFCLAASETLLVLTSEATSLADAYALAKVLSVNQYKKNIKVLVNKSPNVEQAKKTYLHFKSVAERHLNINILPGGAVLRDPLIETAVIKQLPITTSYPDCMASQCIRAVVANMARTKPNIQEEETSSFWSDYLEIIQSDIQLPFDEQRPLKKEVNDEEKTHSSPDIIKTKSSSGSTSSLVQQTTVLQDTTSLKGGFFEPLTLPSPLPLLGSILIKKERGQLSMAEMQKVILYDPALCYRILQSRNPSKQLEEEKSLNINKITDDLGEECVSKILVTSATHGLLNTCSIESYPVINEIWFHSLKCGLTSSALAKLINHPNSDEIFITGLLHDIGQIALFTTAPAIYQNNVSIYSHNQQSFELEVALCDRNHAEFGADMLSSLSLNPYIVDAIRFHHETIDRITTALTTTKVVFAANLLCSTAKKELPEVVKVISTLFSVKKPQIFSILKIVENDSEQIAKELNIPTENQQLTVETEAFIRSLRNQALNYVTLQSIFHNSPINCTFTDILDSVYQGMKLLCGLDNVICLIPNPEKTYLQAKGFTKHFDDIQIKNICFQLKSISSHIVKSYLSSEDALITNTTCDAIADKQLLNLMYSDGLLCVPINSQNRKLGLIICGLKKVEIANYEDLREKIKSLIHHATSLTTNKQNNTVIPFFFHSK